MLDGDTILGQVLDNKEGDTETIAEDPMKKIDIIAAVLLVVGGLNWGLVGITEYDLVGTLFGPMSGLSRIVYVLVGLAGVYQAIQWRGIQRRWATVPMRTARV